MPIYHYHAIFIEGAHTRHFTGLVSSSNRIKTEADYELLKENIVEGDGEYASKAKDLIICNLSVIEK